MSKEMENLTEERNEAEAPDTAKAQELTDDKLDEVAGGSGAKIISVSMPSKPSHSRF